MKHRLVAGLDGRCVGEDEDCGWSAAFMSWEERGDDGHPPSATNSLYTLGAGCPSTLGTTTIPFRTSFLLTLLSARLADCPAEAACTGILFRSIDRTLVVANWPNESGPISTVSPV